MRQKLFIGWSCVHLLFIFLVNLTGCYRIYHEFFNKPQDSPPERFVAGLLNKAPLNYYGRYTGAETGYGFFGINVRSNGLLLALPVVVQAQFTYTTNNDGSLNISNYTGSGGTVVNRDQ